MTSISDRNTSRITLLDYARTVFLISLWVHVSETFRYFLFIMPELRESLAAIPDVAPMNLSVFLIWVIWDTALAALLVFIYRLALSHYEKPDKAVIATTVIMWAFFWLLWGGVINMGIGSSKLLLLALPLAGLEMFAGAWLTSKLVK